MRKISIGQFLTGIMFAWTLSNVAFAGMIRGRVVSESVPFEKEPVAHAAVHLLQTMQGTPADKDGYFTLENLPPGPGALRVTAIGYEAETLPVVIEVDSSSQREVEIVLSVACVFDGYPYTPPGAQPVAAIPRPIPPDSGKCSIGGRIIDGASGRPISGAHIAVGFSFLDEAHERRAGCCFSTKTDSTGIYGLNQRFPGHYILQVCADGYAHDKRLIETFPDSLHIEDFALTPK